MTNLIKIAPLKAFGLAAFISLCANAAAETSSAQEANAGTNLLDTLAIKTEQKNFQQAFELAESQLFAFEGDQQFDFYYGLSASRIGKFDIAEMVFERLVLNYPDQPRYRLELARCYFYSGNNALSEKYFKQVLATNPPYDVQMNIRQFLELIDQQKQSLTGHFVAGVDAVAGYDSNINSATDQDSLDITIPLNNQVLKGRLQLNDEQKARSSAYLNTQGFVNWQKTLTQRSAFDVLALASHRLNTETSDFDVTSVLLDSGYQRLYGNHIVRVGGNFTQAWLDGEELQQIYGASGQWRLALDQTWMLSTRANLNRIDNATNNALDMNQGQLLVTLNRGGKAWQHGFTTIISKDKSLKAENEYQGKNALGLNYQISHLLTDQWTLRASSGWRTNRYHSEFPDTDLFNGGEQRIDNQINFGIGANYKVLPKLSAKVDLSHLQNNSNLESYQHSRSFIQAGVSWLFQ